jgi:hypothetical protein
MIAYKFLHAVRTGPFSAFQWPEPGTWVRVADAPSACHAGVHACRINDLPWWLADELWEVELGGAVQADEHKLIALAGRLRTRIAGWTPVSAQAYAEACAWRTRDRGVQALTRAGKEALAERLGGCETLDDVLMTARRMSDEVPDVRISLTIAGDGAFRALTGAAPTSAYIAAHAALRLDGPAGYASERAWQSRWLADRLRLRAPDRVRADED